MMNLSIMLFQKRAPCILRAAALNQRPALLFALNQRHFANKFRPHNNAERGGNAPDAGTFQNKHGVGQGKFTAMRTGEDQRGKFNPIDLLE